MTEMRNPMTRAEPRKNITSEVTVFLFTPFEALSCLTSHLRFSVSGVLGNNLLAGVSYAPFSAAKLNLDSRLFGVAFPGSDSSSLLTSESFQPDSKKSALRLA